MYMLAGGYIIFENGFKFQHAHNQNISRFKMHPATSKSDIKTSGLNRKYSGYTEYLYILNANTFPILVFDVKFDNH